MNNKSIKILLIEDDPGDADYFKELLSEDKNSPFKIEWADRLKAGLKNLCDSSFDIVLSDLSLPDSQGLDTFTKVHTQTPELPIIVLSGLDDEAIAVNAVKGGAQDYLVKDQIGGNLLKRSIYYAIERKQTEQELIKRQKEIEDLNANLEKRVQEELEKSRQKDYIMIQQSRLAVMGEMMQYIIHQWGQPLWALQLLLHNFKDAFESIGAQNEDTDDLVADGQELVKRMFETVDDFKSFFQTNKKKVDFNVNKNIKDTLRLINPSFKHSNISVTTSVQFKSHVITIV